MSRQRPATVSVRSKVNLLVAIFPSRGWERLNSGCQIWQTTGPSALPQNCLGLTVKSIDCKLTDLFIRWGVAHPVN